MSAKKLTPMLQQYFDIKQDHADAFLFFRLGDFYELFGEDAKEAARLLGLTLTARHKGGPNEIAMCGVPHHSAERYIAQLTKLGKRVAICDQVSDPNLPGIVQRAVTRIVTPGTTLDETVVDSKRNNYLLCLLRDGDLIGLSYMDMATAEFKLCELKDIKHCRDLIFSLDPSEVIVSDPVAWPELESILADRSVQSYQLPFHEDPTKLLQDQFAVKSLKGFGIERLSLGTHTAAALLSYVKETQKTDLSHLTRIQLHQADHALLLDESTIRNLELLQTSKDFRSEGSLIKVLDHTLTRMGARKLRQWLLQPLKDKPSIDLRLDAVQKIMDNQELRDSLQSELKDFFDLERLVGRIGCGRSNARDLNYLKVNLLKIPSIRFAIKQADKDKLLQVIYKALDECQDLVKLLDQRIHPEAVLTLTEGGMIADGFNAELDELRGILKNGKEWLLEYQQQLRDQTGISTLKVKFNKVFGYHIEVSKAQGSKVPDSFELKQTLVNAHRYMSTELNEFEQKFLSAEDRIKALEYELFQETIEKVLPFLEAIQSNADLVAQLDVLQSFAQLALTENYCRPELSEDIGIEISDGRHPVIEQILHQSNQSYIANDVLLNPEQQLIVLTGPNMAGKSSYLRQTALIVLMAHMGSFVPASSARIGLSDRIFTRVGASDDISSGQSTFMVEMTEAANILHNASERSLIIFDELGRGTSTYDGVSIAWAILEHVTQEVKALTLFATHYHELIDVAAQIPNARNASIAVSEKNGEVVFLRKVIDQGIDRSYGIEVAKLAGLPTKIIARAKQILDELEKDRHQEELNLMGSQPSLFSAKPIVEAEPSPHRQLVEKLKDVNVDEMTPMQALQYLDQLKLDLK